MLTFEITHFIKVYQGEKLKHGLSSLIPHAHAKNEVVTSAHGESQRKSAI